MRYIPHTPEDEREMLDAIGIESVEQLFRTIPDNLRLGRPLDLPPAAPECKLKAELEQLAALNRDATKVASFAGAGLYNHYVPAAVGAITSRSEFYTAYTPYQPEVSQGTLQAVFEFQTMQSRLLGMEVANASLYDGSTAVAEAASMAVRISRGKRPKIVLAGAIHPEYVEVVRAYQVSSDESLVVVPSGPGGTTDLAELARTLTPDVAAVVIQSPNFFGLVEDLEAAKTVVDEHGALLIAAFSEPLAFGLLRPPGDCGADIVVGEGQSLGLPVGFGGPLLGLMATRKKYVRAMPGRLVGMTRDRNGNQCFVVTLATREQHIRRARATSNICTNEGLCALAAAVYMSLLGNVGFEKLARLNHNASLFLAQKLAQIPGVSLPFGETPWFNEFVVELPRPAAEICTELASHDLVAGVPLSRFFPEHVRRLLVTTTELNSREQMERYCRLLADIVA